MKHFIFYLALLLVGVLTSSCVTDEPSKDQEKIENLVHTFLDSVDSKSMHDRFWAEDLVYTSSSGTRFGKETIMAGFQSEADQEKSPSTTTYSADDLQVRVFGNFSVVSFELVAKMPDTTMFYLNSGTLIKRNEEWKVILWQATKKK